MLDLRPDEEQKMLTSAIHRLAETSMRKAYREAEESGVIPASVVQSGWEIGLLAASLPEAYGGLGEYSVVTNALAIEEFAWGDLAIALRILQPNLVAIPLMLCGTEEQKAAHLPLFGGATAPEVTAAIIEPRIQYNPFRLTTTAVRQGDEYIIDGLKVYVPAAESAELFLVYADEDGTTQAFLVPAGTTGLTIERPDKLMGVQALPTSQVRLDACRLPASARLGGEAGSDPRLLINHSRVALGAAAVGVARAGFEYARDYAKQRVQFGEPIAQRQSIAFMLADMATEIDEARLLVWEAAWLLDQGQDATAAATIMKQQVDRMVMQVADRAVQILGGYGYIREYPVELWLRNARGFTTFDGLAII